MGRRCCCTTEGCEIGEDTFDRSDSTNIGTDWTELSGEWEIDTNRLHCTADGIALWVDKHLSAKQYPSFVVSIDLPNVVVGCVYGIIANSNLTGTDYYWAKYTPATPSAGNVNGTLAIGKGASTIATLNLGTITEAKATTDKLIMCIGEHPHACAFEVGLAQQPAGIHQTVGRVEVEGDFGHQALLTALPARLTARGWAA
jgi:hypothetical protein